MTKRNIEISSISIELSVAEHRAKYRRKILSMDEIEKFVLRHVDDKIL